MPGFSQVFAALPEVHCLEQGGMEKGSDRNASRAQLKEQHMLPVIPPQKSRKEHLADDKALSKLREKVARFFNRLKHFRRIATRYDKLGNTYLAFLHIVAAVLVIK